MSSLLNRVKADYQALPESSPLKDPRLWIVATALFVPLVGGIAITWMMLTSNAFMWVALAVFTIAACWLVQKQVYRKTGRRGPYRSGEVLPPPSRRY